MHEPVVGTFSIFVCFGWPTKKDMGKRNPDADQDLGHWQHDVG